MRPRVIHRWRSTSAGSSRQSSSRYLVRGRSAEHDRIFDDEADDELVAVSAPRAGGRQPRSGWRGATELAQSNRSSQWPMVVGLALSPRRRNSLRRIGEGHSRRGGHREADADRISGDGNARYRPWWSPDVARPAPAVAMVVARGGTTRCPRNVGAWPRRWLLRSRRDPADRRRARRHARRLRPRADTPGHRGGRRAGNRARRRSIGDDVEDASNNNNHEVATGRHFHRLQTQPKMS